MNVRPSKLRKSFWTHSHHDLVTIVNIKTQHEIAKAYQMHESFRLVASEALGGGKSSSNSPAGAKPVQSYDELVAAFSSIGGSVG